MQMVDSFLYLGDIVNCTGTNKDNIEKRISKGIGIVSQIMSILDTISFGRHYFEIGMLL